MLGIRADTKGVGAQVEVTTAFGEVNHFDVGIRCPCRNAAKHPSSNREEQPEKESVPVMENAVPHPFN